MALRGLPVVKFLVKGSLVGGAVYIAYEQGLLSGSDRGAEALRKAQEAFPPAVEEWTRYFGWQLPPIPKTEFSIANSWNAGVETAFGALSVAPTRACEYTQHSWKYLKDLIK
ncbi:MICOS complex subunit MIC13 [Paroedura picta]|uniref:MICOS complex subunit MIC13 n=1 Tax=Paroedura picta TaxID=143630 RepID=UPI00405698A3